MGKLKNNMMAFMSKHMMACDEAGFLISQSFENRLSLHQRMRLKFHMLSCYLCRRYEKQLEQLDKAVKEYGHDCEHGECQHLMPTEMKTRMVEYVNEELKPKP